MHFLYTFLDQLGVLITNYLCFLRSNINLRLFNILNFFFHFLLLLALKLLIPSHISLYILVLSELWHDSSLGFKSFLISILHNIEILILLTHSNLSRLINIHLVNSYRSIREHGLFLSLIGWILAFVKRWERLGLTIFIIVDALSHQLLSQNCVGRSN